MSNFKNYLMLVPITSSLALYSSNILVMPGLAALDDIHLESTHPVIKMVLKEKPVSLNEKLIAEGNFSKYNDGPVFAKSDRYDKSHIKCTAPPPPTNAPDTASAVEAELLVAKLILT